MLLYFKSKVTNNHIVYYLTGGFHIAMTFTGGLCLVSLATIVFSPMLKKHAPFPLPQQPQFPTSSTINIPN